MGDGEQQSSGNPTAPSSDSEVAALKSQIAELTTKLTQSERSYTGLDGNFKSIKTERDALEAQVTQLNKLAGDDRQALTKRIDDLATTHAAATRELETVRVEKTNLEKTSGALKILVDEYPDLVPAFAKKLIRIDGLEGEDLKTYLNTWKTSVQELELGKVADKNNNTAPPPPNQDIGSVSLDEAADKKLDALRKGGPKSEEYLKWQSVETELIKKRKK